MGKVLDTLVVHQDQRHGRPGLRRSAQPSFRRTRLRAEPRGRGGRHPDRHGAAVDGAAPPASVQGQARRALRRRPLGPAAACRGGEDRGHVGWAIARVHVLSCSDVSIGRRKQCQIVTRVPCPEGTELLTQGDPNLRFSRYHCRIEFSDGHYRLLDGAGIPASDATSTRVRPSSHSVRWDRRRPTPSRPARRRPSPSAGARAPPGRC